MKRLVRSSTAESVAYFLLLVAVSLAARMWFLDLQLVGGVRIDATLIALALLAIGRGARFGIIAGFLLGLVADATHPGWLGAASAGFAVVGFFSGSFGQALYMDKASARGLLVVGAVIIFDIINGLFTVGIGHPFLRHAVGTVVSAALTGGTAVLLTRLARYWRRRPTAAVEVVGNE